jgi:Spy/CpxP family protein refolding chaperone
LKETPHAASNYVVIPTMLRTSLPTPVSFTATIVTALLLTVPVRSANAQTPSAAPPPDVQKTLNDIGDLDILKALVPLKLTAEQIEKLRDVLNAVAATSESKRKADHETIRALSAEVSKARTEALAGADISSELEQRVLKAFSEVDQRFAEAKKEAVNQVYAVARPLLTDTQKDEIDRQVVKMLGGKRLVPKEYQRDPKKAPREALLDLSLAYYIERILLFDRARDLLSKIKPAATAAPASDGAGATPPEQKP